ncbi:MAG TPA: hypothetical protein VF606_11835, partial [Geminicoccaceae bacterium]
MRLVLVIAVLLVLAVGGYRFISETAQQAPASLEEAARQAGEAARTAMRAAGDLAREGGQQLREGAAEMGEQARGAAAGARDFVVGGVDVGRELGGVADGVRGALDTARVNAEAPQAALPTLHDAEAALGRLETRVEGFSVETRRGLATAVAATLPTVRGLVDQIKANPRAAETLGPSLDAIVARLEAWARGPAA